MSTLVAEKAPTRHDYTLVHDWLNPPPHLLFGDTHGLAQDARGNIYVAHTVRPNSPCQDAIAVFDAAGNFLTSWGGYLAGGAHGLEIRDEGGTEYLYHCDTLRRRVVKTTTDGTLVWEREAPEEAGVYRDGAPFIPTNVAFAPDGDFFVTDGYGSDYVHRFGADGAYRDTFGGKGSEPGRLRNAHGIGLDTRGGTPLLAVADRGNARIQYFTLDGEHVGFVAGGMRQPCHIRFSGKWALVPDLRSVVTLLDGDNNVAAQFGDGHPSNLRDVPREQFIPGKFIHPHDAIFLQNGDILVAEWVPVGRATLLRRAAA